MTVDQVPTSTLSPPPSVPPPPLLVPGSPWFSWTSLAEQDAFHAVPRPLGTNDMRKRNLNHDQRGADLGLVGDRSTLHRGVLLTCGHPSALNLRLL